MQPTGLRGTAHEHHVAAREGELEGFVGGGGRWGGSLAGWIGRRAEEERGFVFEEEIAGGAEGEGGDGGGGAEEAFVVAVVGDAVRAGGVVVHQAEIVPRRGGGFGGAEQRREAVRDRARLAPVADEGRGGLGWRVVKGAGGGEEGGGVDAEDGGAVLRIEVLKAR